MSTDCPPEFVPPNQWVDLFNCVIQGGMVTPRPGYVSAGTNPVSPITAVLSSLNHPYSIVVDTSPANTNSDVIYYSAQNTVGWVHKDGTNATVLYTANAASYGLLGIAMTGTGNTAQLYIANPGGASGGEVITMNYDGTNAVSVLTGGNLVRPYHIAAFNSNVLYFTSRSVAETYSPDYDGIYRMPVVGGVVTRLVVASVAFGMAIDAANGWLFAGVTERDATAFPPRPTNYIKRYTITGAESNSNFAASVNTAVTLNPATDYGPNWSLLSLQLDVSAGYAYAIIWHDSAAFRLQRYTYNGTAGTLTNPVTLFDYDTSMTPTSIFGDTAGGEIYWTSNLATPNGKIYQYGTPAGGTRVAIDAYWWKRSQIGVGDQNKIGDFALIQMMNLDIGGSDFNVWYPTTDTVYKLVPGYTAGTNSVTAPDMWIQLSRTADPAITDPIIPANSYARVSAACIGGGLNTCQGGIGLAWGNGGYVWNYRVPQNSNNVTYPSEIQNLFITGSVNSSNGGSFTLTLNGTNATSAINYSSNGTTLASNIQTGLNNLLGANSTVVSYNPALTNPYTSQGYAGIQITFGGNFAQTGLPLLKIVTNSLNGTAVPDIQVDRLTYDGGTGAKGISYPYGIQWLYPAGLPSPNSLNATLSAINTGTALIGYYDYYLSYVSTQLKLESPPVRIGPIQLTNQAAAITWVNPTTNYFDDYFSGTSFKGGPVIDMVRVYRRNLGATSGDTTGQGATAYLVNEVQANKASYLDNKADSALTGDPVPFFKDYPPSDAQYIEVHEQHAYYAPLAAGSRLLWASEGPITGGASAGEDGYCYVDPASYYVIDDRVANDTQITALKSFGNVLVVWTPDRAFRVDCTDIDNGNPDVKPIPNAPGCVCHWCVAESGPLPDLPGGVLLYPHPKGGIYVFDGRDSQNPSRKALQSYIDQFSNVTWQDVTKAPGTLLSWYYASAVIDPRRNRYLLAAPIQSGNREIYCYNFDTLGWSRWGMNPSFFALGRETNTSATDIGRPLVHFGLGNSIYKFKEGMGDNGVSFTWRALTGKYSSPDNVLRGKQWFDGIVLVKKIPYTTAADITVTSYLDDSVVATTTQVIPATGDLTVPFSFGKNRGRFCQLAYSGDVDDDTDQPGIIGWFVDQTPAGARMRIKP